MATRCPICASTSYKTRFEIANFSLLQCEACNLIFKSTIFEAIGELEALYNSDDYWNTANRSNSGVNYNPQHSKIKLYRSDLNILAKLQPQKGRLLDVGCAKGVFLDVARREGWMPTGLELSAWASTYARENFGVEVFTGTLDESPWPATSFDVITMFDVIEHLANPADIISRVNLLLKPGGIVLIATPNGTSFLHRMAEFIFRATRGGIVWPLYQIYGFGPGGHVIFLSKNTLTNLLKNHGFEILHVRYYAVDQGLWRPTTAAEKWAGVVDNLIGSLFNTKYHIVMYARKVQTL